MTRWNLDAEENEKAYNDDEFVNEDWQLLDFLRRCGLPYPLDDNGNAAGQIYKLWTKELPLITSHNINSNTLRETVDHAKPWWKFWE